MAGRKQQQGEPVGGGQATVAQPVHDLAEPAFAQFEHMVFVVVVVRVLAETAVAQPQAGQAEQGGVGVLG